MSNASNLKSSFNQRVESLDYLRGIAAFGIMIYHITLFNYGEVDSSSFIGKVKIYGVSIFYILSGLTLYFVYANKFKPNKKEIISFFIKRFFRIVPLLWLASILTLLVSYNPAEFSYNKLFVNITVLPGIIRPASFFANGAWSIGNELFFYILFPVLIYMASIRKIYLYLIIGCSFLLMSYFAFYVLKPAVPLGLQWSAYVNPLGQLFFFVMGMGLAAIDSTYKIITKKTNVIICAFLLLLIIFYPVKGEPIMLVIGINRLVLSLVVTLLCFFFYKTDFGFLPKFICKLLKMLGEISYSLYLLHPIVFHVLVWVFRRAGIAPSATVIMLVTIILSVFFSYLNYLFFEKYFIKKGKELLAKINLTHAASYNTLIK